MKKFFSLVLAMVICLSMAAPVMAEEFVDSIGYKDGPSIVTVKDADGNDVQGKIVNANGEVIGYLDEDCLLITPISEAAESDEIPDDAQALLIDLYNQLKDGSMSLPYDKFNANLDPARMVIREMVDATWLCVGLPQDCAEIIEPAGVHVEIVFDLGVSANEDVYVMSYKHNAWNPIVETVNNGDGTITCVFEDFCPIVFSIDTADETPKTGDEIGANMGLWIGLMAVCVVAIAGLTVYRRRAR
ncbi:MAG: LPXTG cell wall anchor domain-containing protein [Firmicutes bacterium]|nr:LPXTG cell wall anchor domain-containing protein [Bacillota bacterium]